MADAKPLALTVDSNYAALQSPAASKQLKVANDPNDPNDSSAANDANDANNGTHSKTGQLVPFAQLFVYADAVDALLMAVGTLAAMGSGVAQPLQVVFFGDITNSLNANTGSQGDFRAGVSHVARNFALASTAVIVCSFLQAACWAVTGSRQTKRIRSAYVGAILTNEIGWYDLNDPMELSTRVADAAVAIQEGMGRKIGDSIQFGSMAIAACVIGFIKGWELALVLLASAPVIAVSGYLSVRMLATATQASSDAYGKAGAIAQESLSNIRTVHMFNAIDHFAKKYESALRLSTKAGIKKGLAVGLGTGMVFLTIFCTYAFGMYFGALMIANDRRDECVGSSCYDSGRVLIVFLTVIFGAAAFGQAAPSVQAIVSARAAAFDVFAVINRQSQIDPLSEDGKKLDKVDGNIEIENVSFAYPSRPEVKVCSNYTLTIEAGETVALVGPSGSGKSTIVSLLERFYDPLSGLVKVDGVDVRELNVKWLREQVGLVGQEPALFATSIMENIRHGSPGATDEQVIEAAKMANAYTFIKEFPQGFATEVGERGAQLSGGQKQRIAIARAIIKNPPILLLDEATSALDTESERIVQESLDKLLASSSRTTIIVAHRLSTIRNANKIAVHSGGSIVEIGTHDELMKNPSGHYRLLAEAQNRKGDGDGGGDARVGVVLDTKLSLKDHEGDVVVMENVDNDHSLEPEGTSESDDVTRTSVSRLWKMSFVEWKFLVLGGVGAVVNAAMYPAWGILFTKIIVLFFEDRPRDYFLRTTRWLSVAWVCLGVGFLVSSVLQNYGFAVVSQRLVSRVRLSAFSAMLQQEVGWFDLDENSSGALVTRLATDSAVLQALASGTLNQGLVAVTAVGISFSIAFYSSWEMTLLLLASSPIMIIGSMLQTTVMTGTNNNKKLNDADSNAGSLLSEAIGSIRTVASFSMEKSINSAYAFYVSASSATDTKSGIIVGIGFGLAQGGTWLILSLLFYVGGIWVSNGRITFEDMFMVMMVMMFSSFAIGAASQNATDQTKVKTAAARMFRIIDRTPEIDSTSSSGDILPNVSGHIEFKSVAFAYPSRPTASIYKNYNLKIASGQTVALVGASGSGKSTAISLLERFYDPASGSVTLDGADLRKLRLPWLRERISLVSQEPVLFAGTIGENIAMGKPGATRAEVEDAAKKANAYDFIMNFPSGFDTDVGDRGAQVSGGQKQRIAIARAILRDPEVLLLDEATSALDNESERVVQASLDRLLASKKRTTIIVAHRLSTIRNADLIAVTKDGAIVEQGTHDQLMGLPNGVYKSLVARQTGA